MKSLLQLASAIVLVSSVSAHAQTALPTVSLLFAGDIVLDGVPGQEIEQGRDPFSAVAELINRADIRIGNLECVVATGGEPEEKIFKFRANPRTLTVLKNHFDAVSIANNHSGDYGRAAFEEMLGLLPQHDIRYFGGGHNLTEAHTPLIIERNGLRIALLGYNEFLPRSFEADAHTAGTAWSEDEQVSADIHKARSFYKADLVIPIMHWGWENDTHSSTRQEQLAHLMVDAGADLVIGGHPHVRQEIEYYRGKPIVYSVGNFMIDALDNEEQTKGWIVQFQLDKLGVKSWSTRIAHIDDQGLPAFHSHEQSPCGSRDSPDISLCTVGE